MAEFEEELAEGAMKPTGYVQEVVLPTAHEYNQDRGSRRLMYLTCMTVFHIRDHFAKLEKEMSRRRCGVRSAIHSTW
jgi:hypothetical protein